MGTAKPVAEPYRSATAFLQMNWLAHVFLSPPDIEFQLGNLLADFVRGAERERMSARFKEGVQCHMEIDAFTDAHPLVQRSKARIEPRFRRFAGVLVDIYYDHLLARSWERFSEVPLREFTSNFQARALDYTPSLSPEVASNLQRMMENDRFWRYREKSGIQLVLQQLSGRLNLRWNRDIRLHEALPSIVACDQEFEGDFETFFPELLATLPFKLGTTCSNQTSAATLTQ